MEIEKIVIFFYCLNLKISFISFIGTLVGTGFDRIRFLPHTWTPFPLRIVEPQGSCVSKISY